MKSCNLSAEKMKNSILRIGIVGLGNMGSDHARRIVAGEIPGAVLAAVCDQDPARLTPWQEKAGARIHTSYAEMLSSDIDAVIIASPHFSHTQQGIDALRAGHHVLVEKPISVQKADAEALIAAHKGAPQVFAAVFNQRTDPAYVKLKSLIEGGELGSIQRISWTVTDWYRPQHYYNSGNWRATWAGEGGGVLLNQCPHQLDLYQWMFGMPTQVRAFCQKGRFHDIEVEDSVTAYFEHASGATGVFITTTGEAPGTNRLEVAGDLGKVVIEDRVLRLTRNAVGAAEFSRTANSSFSKPETTQESFSFEGSGEQHAGILKNFVTACLQGIPPIAPACEGLHSIELANSMLYSSALGATLTLPLDSAAYAAWLAERIAGSRYKKPPATAAIAADFASSKP